ncbi:MAG: S4 domain-containing protein YaaA [Anaerorhabdus sp.]
MTKISTEFITLTQFLKMEDFISSGGEAKIFLSQYPVFINDETENRRGKKLYKNDKIEINKKIFVIE